MKEQEIRKEMYEQHIRNLEHILKAYKTTKKNGNMYVNGLIKGMKRKIDPPIIGMSYGETMEALCERKMS